MGLRRTCSIAGSDSPDGEQLHAQPSAARQLAEAFEVDVAAADDARRRAGRAAPCRSSRGRQAPGSRSARPRASCGSRKSAWHSTSWTSLAVSMSSTSRRMIANVSLPEVLRLRAVRYRLAAYRCARSRPRGTSAARRCPPAARRRKSCTSATSRVPPARFPTAGRRRRAARTASPADRLQQAGPVLPCLRRR